MRAADVRKGDVVTITFEVRSVDDSGFTSHRLAGVGREVAYLPDGFEVEVVRKPEVKVGQIWCRYPYPDREVVALRGPLAVYWAHEGRGYAGDMLSSLLLRDWMLKQDVES